MSAGDLVLVTHRDQTQEFAVLAGSISGRLQVRSIGTEIIKSIAPRRVELIMRKFDE